MTTLITTHEAAAMCGLSVSGFKQRVHNSADHPKPVQVNYGHGRQSLYDADALKAYLVKRYTFMHALVKESPVATNNQA